MRFNLHLNQIKCLEWGINPTQGFIIDLLTQVHTWAKPAMIKNELFYFVARSKVAEELPLIFDIKKGKANHFDSVYRVFKQLEKKGLIKHIKSGTKDMISLTEKGKTWNKVDNSESHPTKLGISSDSNSDTNPTYNTTILDNTNNNKEEFFEIFWRSYHKHINKPKTDRVAAIKHWKKLNKTDKQKAIKMIPIYSKSIDNHQYAHKARTYLADRLFENEFETQQPKQNNFTW